MTPPAWDILATELWHLSPHESKTFWYAVAHARTSRPVALRQHLSLVGHVCLDVDHLCAQVLTPGALAATLEALVRERQLRRVQANHILEALLVQVDASGTWKGNGWRGPVPATTHPPDVQVLAETGR